MIPDFRRLNPRHHAPELGERPGTFRCKCGNVYSPTAFEEHLAGKPVRDGFDGVYTVGPDDEWLKSLKRQDAPTPAPEESGELRLDADGSHWRHFENEYRQRAWRCVSGPRVGTVKLDESLAPTAEVRRPKRVAEGVSKSPFFD